MQARREAGRSGIEHAPRIAVVVAALVVACPLIGLSACKLTVPGGGDGSVSDGGLDAAPQDAGPGGDGSPDGQGAGDAIAPDAGPPRCSGGIYKVTENHQWTCSEQPEWGNEVLIHVRDENGVGVPGATVRLDWPNTTLRPIYNDTDPPAPSDIPATVQTDGSGTFHGWNYWPINENGYMVFNLSVDGCASDVATEVTTGWWETDNSDCRFCDPGFTHRNVWGHWSYTLTFQLDLGANDACLVPNDHAGQAGCNIEHIHHDPGHGECWSIP